MKFEQTEMEIYFDCCSSYSVLSHEIIKIIASVHYFVRYVHNDVIIFTFYFINLVM